MLKMHLTTDPYGSVEAKTYEANPQGLDFRPWILYSVSKKYHGYHWRNLEQVQKKRYRHHWASEKFLKICYVSTTIHYHHRLWGDVTIGQKMEPQNGVSLSWSLKLPGTRRKANVSMGNFLYAVIYRFNILLKEIVHQPECSNDCDCHLNCLAKYWREGCGVMWCDVMFLGSMEFLLRLCLVNLFQWRAIVAQQIVHLGVGGNIRKETAYHANSAQFPKTTTSPALK